MKRFFSLLMAVLSVFTITLLAGCSQGNPDNTSDPQDEQKENTVNLMDMYTVTDPEGVEYDERIALYMPVLESDPDSYNIGIRHLFAVLYGKEGKGVYMYDVQVFDTEEHAAAYAAEAGATADGVVCVSTSDEAFFVAMESFIPDLATFVDNMKQSGMTEFE